VKTTINIKGNLVDLSQPKVMGILNVTPDSFYDGGKHNSESKLENQIAKLISEGADFIDIGGYSTRPDASDISPKEEWNRVKSGILEARNQDKEIFISVDTFRAEIAQKAIELGADLINDISAGNLDSQMFQTVADLQVPYIMMHTRGTPNTLKQLTDYENIVDEILNYFVEKVEQLKKLGVKDIVTDLGFGFAKTIEQNYFLLKNLAVFQELELPMLVGVSRKSMIYKTLGIQPSEALNGTTALNVIALQNGANILRVHDVKETKETIQLLETLNQSKA
jgi:dihydropteroate synthase